MKRGIWKFWRAGNPTKKKTLVEVLLLQLSVVGLVKTLARMKKQKGNRPMCWKAFL